MTRSYELNHAANSIEVILRSL